MIGRRTFRSAVRDIGILCLAGSAAFGQAKRAAAPIRVPDGTWKGTTVDGQALSFTINNYQLSGAAEVPLAFSCSDSEFRMSGSLSIPDVSGMKQLVSRTTGAFTIMDGTVGDVGVKVTFRGSIQRDTSASGTITYSGPCSPVRKAWKATLAKAEAAVPVAAPIGTASTADPPPLKPGARLIEWSSLTDCDVVRGHKLSNSIEIGLGVTGGGTAAYVLRPIPPATEIEMAAGQYGSRVLSGMRGRPPTASVMTGMIVDGKPQADFYSALGVGTKILLPGDDIEICGVRMKSGELEITDRGFIVTAKP